MIAMSSACLMANHIESELRVLSIRARHIAVMTFTVSDDTETVGVETGTTACSEGWGEMPEGSVRAGKDVVVDSATIVRCKMFTAMFFLVPGAERARRLAAAKAAIHARPCPFL